MVKVSTRGRYGLLMMFELALQADQGPVRLSTIARNQEIPERYLAQLAQELRKAGLVRSVRGYGGGFLLTSPPSKIKLIEIVVTLEGPVSPADCVVDPKMCDRQSYCATTDLWREIGKAITGILKSRTLQDLVIEHNRKKRRHPIRRPVRTARSLKMLHCPANRRSPVSDRALKNGSPVEKTGGEALSSFRAGTQSRIHRFIRNGQSFAEGGGQGAASASRQDLTPL